MSHFFRHTLILYKGTSERLKKKFAREKMLAELEGRLDFLGGKNPGHPKVTALLERVRKIQASLE